MKLSIWHSVVFHYYLSYTSFPVLLSLQANIDHPEMKARIKAEAIAGIPHICIYTPSGSKVAGMGASFKKLEPLKKNLRFLAGYSGRMEDVRVDPNGFLTVKGGQHQQGTAASANGSGGAGSVHASAAVTGKK
jgi:hypothetical protein